MAAGARVSMDGQGRSVDNVFSERLWRSLQYEAVYLDEVAGGRAAGRWIGRWMESCNGERPHSEIGGRTPRAAQQGGTGNVRSVLVDEHISRCQFCA